MATKSRKGRKKPGPPAKYGYRPTLTIRLQEPIYERIKDAAFQHGKSLSEEIEDQLQLIDDLATAERQLESMRDATSKMHRMAASVLADAAAERTAVRVKNLRDAGLQILREEGIPKSVTIPIEMLYMEAKLIEQSPSDKSEPNNEQQQPPEAGSGTGSGGERGS
jgi:hypothetical protein